MYFIFGFIDWFVIDSPPQRSLKRLFFYKSNHSLSLWGILKEEFLYLLLVELIQ